MAKNQTIDVQVDVLKADAKALSALEEIAKYAPANAEYALDKLQAAFTAFNDGNAAAAKAEAAWKAARDVQIAGQWAFHNAMLGAKRQVLAQFGDDSNEAQSVGLKKASEYKSPRRKAATTTTAPAPAAAQ